MQKPKKDIGIYPDPKKKESVAIVIGGSILAQDDLDHKFIGRMAEELARLCKQRKLFVVVGGGAPARKYIGAARALGVSEDRLDLIGIQATRLNAQILICALERLGAKVNQEIPRDVRNAAALSAAGRYDIVVMGGTVPGHSTDYVAVELAIQTGCVRLVNATNVDGVYDSDPGENDAALLLPKLNFGRLLEVVKDREWSAAGSPGIFDGPATVLLASKAIPTCVVVGTELENFGKAVAGRSFRGTTIIGPQAFA